MHNAADTPRGQQIHVVLISGVPAAGKSTFGRWLSERKGYCHLDLENIPKGSDWYARSEWDTFVRDRSDIAASTFATKLGTCETPDVVLDWGFPIQCIGMVRSLKAVGVTLWWFNSDWDIARVKFVQRQTPNLPVGLFDRQRKDVTSIWPSIEALFSPNIIETLSPAGEYVSSPELYKRMFPETTLITPANA